MIDQPQTPSTDHQDDTFDRLRRRIFWMMPSGLYVIGSRSGDARNAMTLNWATQVSMDPVRLGIGVKKTALTHRLIAKGGSFTFNFLDRADRSLVRKFVKPAPWDEEARTLNGVSIFDAPSGVPVLTPAVAYFDCRLWQAVDAGDHTFFIGDVIHGEMLREGENSPEVLRMEDTRMNYGG